LLPKEFQPEILHFVTQKNGFLRSRSTDAVIHVYDERGNVIETHECTGEVQRAPEFFTRITSHFPLKRISRFRFHRVTAGRSHDAVIRVYDEAGNVIETHEHTGDFKEW
jgi:hypothetical protein